MRPFLCPPTHKIPVLHNTAASIAHFVLDLRFIHAWHHSAVNVWLQTVLQDSSDLWLDDSGICPRRSLKTLRVWYQSMPDVVGGPCGPTEALFNRATQTVQFRDMKSFQPTPLSDKEYVVWVNQLVNSLVPSHLPIYGVIPWQCPVAVPLPTKPDASSSSSCDEDCCMVCWEQRATEGHKGCGHVTCCAACWSKAQYLVCLQCQQLVFPSEDQDPVDTQWIELRMDVETNKTAPQQGTVGGPTTVVRQTPLPKMPYKHLQLAVLFSRKEEEGPTDEEEVASSFVRLFDDIQRVYKPLVRMQILIKNLQPANGSSHH